MNKKIQETKLHAIPRFPAGSFAVHIGDHFRSGDHLRRCTCLVEGAQAKTIYATKYTVNVFQGNFRI